ncbi:MAG: ABC transporter-related protein [candidate division TM6 bacterium GW2011_GWE2_42_60]|nr:MAG: ABC transporter-related protein [candidate division TM6 bacterium GW2011_GWE2_42_60]HBY05717.1 macrolide ABC transporter ATP-binding protein [Candidatus Dependentiae bacterium]
MELIRTEHISRSFTIGNLTHQILTDICITVQKGEFLSIIGKSGSGKTTLMNILGCLDQPTSGSYFLEGKEISKLNPDELATIRNNQIGFIFQTFNLLDDLTALDNVALPLLYAGSTKKESRVRAQVLLQALDLDDRLAHFPKQLSGGQRQRVAIARALVNQPSLILADEPTGNLDSKTGVQTMEIFKKLNAEHGITFIIVTHDREIAHQTQRTIQLVDGKVVV